MSPYRTSVDPRPHDCPSEDAGHECLCYEEPRDEVEPARPVDHGYRDHFLRRWWPWRGTDSAISKDGGR